MTNKKMSNLYLILSDYNIFKNQKSLRITPSLKDKFNNPYRLKIFSITYNSYFEYFKQNIKRIFFQSNFCNLIQMKNI